MSCIHYSRSSEVLNTSLAGSLDSLVVLILPDPARLFIVEPPILCFPSLQRVQGLVLVGLVIVEVRIIALDKAVFQEAPP